MVPEGQAWFQSCGGRHITQDRNCPVGAGLLTRLPWTVTPAGRDDPARRTLQGFALWGEFLVPVPTSRDRRVRNRG